MDSQNKLNAVSGEQLSFFALFTNKKLKIEIPIIQRDYAQGRYSQSAVRQAFLDALFEYLQKGQPFRDLDFVYGNIYSAKQTSAHTNVQEIARRFIPLDGQQRLTTLFLLHWYLAQISGTSASFRETLTFNKKSLFSYETRPSSSEFCDALAINDINFDSLLKGSGDTESVSATIQNAGWFYLSWTDDPTIASMLIMLDAIHSKFHGHPEFFERLTDSDKPVITFRFLNLQDFNLTDDLYIKMNARGKPLTNFENFKAQLEKAIKHFQEPWPEYWLDFGNGLKLVSGYEYFIHKIDTEWADLFWTYRNEATRDNSYDDELMNLISLVVANFEILRADRENDVIQKRRERLFGAGGSLRRLTFSEYESLEALSQQHVIHLISILDILCQEKNSEGRLEPYIKDNLYYLEEKTFIKVLANNTSYPEKLRFHSFYAGLLQGVKSGELLSWMRVVFNLTENTIINDAEEYNRALRSLRDLAVQLPNESINELLMRDVEISFFPEGQVFEEKIKAHLLETSPDWNRAVLGLEAHTYFTGQIGFVLKFSGIVDYYQENKNTDWGDEADQKYFKEFTRYAHSAAAVFDRIESSSGNLNYAWERAVLTKGEYLTRTSSDRFNLLSSRSNKVNLNRDHSWKRLLRFSPLQEASWSAGQGYVKAVFDDRNFNANDVGSSLEAICQLATIQAEKVDWKYLLIRKPTLFKTSKQGFIVKNSDEVVLLHESQRNHYQSEIFTKYLDLELQDQKLEVAPFETFAYQEVKNSVEWNVIEFSGFNYTNEKYEMQIWYDHDKYFISFYSDNQKPIHPTLIPLLEKEDFYLSEESDVYVEDDIEGYENSYLYDSESVDLIIQKLKNLNKKLSEISSQ
jgi:hypothetical protein